MVTNIFDKKESFVYNNANMPVPLLIPAHNEVDTLPVVLAALPPDLVEPIILVNGCEDGTAEVGRRFGATVLELEDPGKLPAIQEGYRHLGNRALETVLMLDADATPDFPVRWARSMQRALARPGVTVVSGPYRYVCENSKSSNYLRTARAYLRDCIARLHGRSIHPCGRNLGTRIGSRQTLEALLELPHYWPGEDAAISDTLCSNGGSYVQHVDPLAMVRTSDRFLMPLNQRIRLQFRPDTDPVLLDQYTSRAASGSRPYFGELRQP